MNRATTARRGSARPDPLGRRGSRRMTSRNPGSRTGRRTSVTTPWSGASD